MIISRAGSPSALTKSSLERLLNSAHLSLNNSGCKVVYTTVEYLQCFLKVGTTLLLPVKSSPELGVVYHELHPCLFLCFRSLRFFVKLSVCLSTIIPFLVYASAIRSLSLSNRKKTSVSLPTSLHWLTFLRWSEELDGSFAISWSCVAGWSQNRRSSYRLLLSSSRPRNQTIILYGPQRFCSAQEGQNLLRYNHQLLLLQNCLIYSQKN